MTHFLKVSFWTHWLSIFCVSVHCISLATDVQIPVFGQSEPLQAGSWDLWPNPEFFASSLSGMTWCSRFVCMCSAQVRNQMFSQRPGSFHCEMAPGPPHLSAQGAHCPRLVTVQWAEAKQTDILKQDKIHHKFIFILQTKIQGHRIFIEPHLSPAPRCWDS